MTVTEEISKIGIVPVIAADRAEDAEPLAKALCRGGLPCAEVTFRTAAAEECIRIMTEKFPQMLVGAGTVLTTEQADRAAAAGAKFIVSPGLNPKVVSHCIDKGLPVIPGCSNPSDVEAAIELGLSKVKFFPAEAAGGLAMIKAMSAPYSQVRFMPTGGITPDNLRDYLSFDKVIACGGSWMVKKELIAGGDFAKIESLARDAVMKMLDFEIMNISIRGKDKTEAENASAAFARLFGLNGNKGILPFFSDEQKSGCITVGTRFMERAVYFLEKNGAELDPDAQKLVNGKLAAAGLKGEFCGFTVRLVQK